MALKTFQNLKPTRQEEILQASYEEFALKGYKSASLSEIIKKVGVAKGSFYRYFSSKKELYTYLIQDSSARRLSNLDKLIDKPGIDFFDLIRQNFLDKIDFDKANPLIGGFLYKIMHEKDNSEVAEIIQDIYSTIIEQTKQIISLEKFKNQLSVTDPEMVAFQIFHMQLWLYDYVAYKYKINYEQNIRKQKPIMNLADNELGMIIDKAVEMLKSGIQKHKL